MLWQSQGYHDALVQLGISKSAAIELADERDKEIMSRPPPVSRWGVNMGTAALGSALGQAGMHGFGVLQDKVVSPYVLDKLKNLSPAMGRQESSAYLSDLIRASGEKPSDFSVHYIPGFQNAAAVPYEGVRRLINEKFPGQADVIAQAFAENMPGGDVSRLKKLFLDKRDAFALDPEFAKDEILAHEVGHATGGTLGKGFRKAMPFLGAGLQGAGGLMQAGGTLLNKPDEMGYRKLNLAQKLSLPVALLGGAMPTIEEIRANVGARQLAAKAGKQLPRFWDMVKGGLTSHAVGELGRPLVGVGIPLATTALAYHFLNKRRRKELEEAGIEQPKGKVAELSEYQKTAGYWQNIVGVPDTKKLKALRQQYLAAEAAEADYDKREEQAAEKALGKQPSYPESKSIPGSILKRSLVGAGIGAGAGGLTGLAAILQGGKPSAKDIPLMGGALGIGGALGGLVGALTNDSRMRQDPKEKKMYDEYWKKRNEWSRKYWKDVPDESPTLDFPDPKMFGGKPVGYLDKYVSIPGMIGFAGEESMTGAPTGRGYLSKKELLKQLQGQSKGWAALDGSGKELDLIKAVQESPYRHFTSTEAG